MDFGTTNSHLRTRVPAYLLIDLVILHLRNVDFNWGDFEWGGGGGGSISLHLMQRLSETKEQETVCVYECVCGWMYV